MSFQVRVPFSSYVNGLNTRQCVKTDFTYICSSACTVYRKDANVISCKKEPWAVEVEQCEDLNLTTSHTLREHVFLDHLPPSQCPQCEMVCSLHQRLLLELYDTRSPLAVDCVREAILKSGYDGRTFGENDKPHPEWARDAWIVSLSQLSKLCEQELELIDQLYH